MRFIPIPPFPLYYTFPISPFLSLFPHPYSKFVLSYLCIVEDYAGGGIILFSSTSNNGSKLGAVDCCISIANQTISIARIMDVCICECKMRNIEILEMGDISIIKTETNNLRTIRLQQLRRWYYCCIYNLTMTKMVLLHPRRCPYHSRRVVC